MKKLRNRLAIYPKDITSIKKLWDKQCGKKLAKHVPWNHAVDLESGTHPKFFLTYKFIETKN